MSESLLHIKNLSVTVGDASDAKPILKSVEIEIPQLAGARFFNADRRTIERYLSCYGQHDDGGRFIYYWKSNSRYCPSKS